MRCGIVAVVGLIVLSRAAMPLCRDSTRLESRTS